MLREDRTSLQESSALTRRGVLGWILTLLPLSFLSGCARETPRTAPLRVPLSDLEEGARLRVLVGSVPVEVRLEEGLPKARSLLCTHQGCEVSWIAEKERYACPCHEAWFDGEGVPIEGPAHKPLRDLTTWVDEEDAVILPLV